MYENKVKFIIFYKYPKILFSLFETTAGELEMYRISAIVFFASVISFTSSLAASAQMVGDYRCSDMSLGANIFNDTRKDRSQIESSQSDSSKKSGRLIGARGSIEKQSSQTNNTLDELEYNRSRTLIERGENCDSANKSLSEERTTRIKETVRRDVAEIEWGAQERMNETQWGARERIQEMQWNAQQSMSEDDNYTLRYMADQKNRTQRKELMLQYLIHN